jgi:hypothetical protein
LKHRKEDFLMTTGSRMSVAAVVAAGLLLGVTPAVAHHSAAAAYDETKNVEVQGTVKRVLVRNPHSWVFLDSTDEKGQTVEWQIEMGGTTSMAWTKEALPVGAACQGCGTPVSSARLARPHRRDLQQGRRNSDWTSRGTR